jgi:hypothetical protein
MSRSRVVVWRDAVRDSMELKSTAKLVAFVISTYMNGSGVAWPGKSAIAAGGGLGSGKRSVDGAIDQLEAAGYLIVIRSKGGRHTPFRYIASLPTSHPLRRWFDSNGAADRRSTSHQTTPNVASRATEIAESDEVAAARAPDGRAALRERCIDCGDEFVTDDEDETRCTKCALVAA